MKLTFSLLLVIILINSSLQYSYLGSNFTIYQGGLYDRVRSQNFQFNLHQTETVLPQNCSNWRTYLCNTTNNCHADPQNPINTSAIHSNFSGLLGYTEITMSQFRANVSVNVADKCDDISNKASHSASQGIFGFALNSDILDEFESSKFSLALGSYPVHSEQSQGETDDGFIMFDEYSQFISSSSEEQFFQNVSENWEMTIESVTIDGIQLAGQTRVLFDPLGQTSVPEAIFDKYMQYLNDSGYDCGWKGIIWRDFGCYSTVNSTITGNIFINDGLNSISIGGSKTISPWLQSVFPPNADSVFTNLTMNVTKGNADAIILGRGALQPYYTVFDYSTPGSPSITFHKKSNWGGRTSVIITILEILILSALGMVVCICGLIILCCYCSMKKDAKKLAKLREQDQALLYQQKIQTPNQNTNEYRYQP